MKKNQSSSRQYIMPDSNSINSSSQALQYGKPQYYENSPGKRTNEQQYYDQYQNAKRQKKQIKKEGLDHLYKENYQPAKYSKAVQYRNERSYMKKFPSGHYKELDLFQNIDELKGFGLGAYFYIDFFRRMTWLFFFMTIIQGITIYINAIGNGMGDYSASFSSYLISTTLGNYNQNNFTEYDGYIVTILPCVNYLALWIFFLIWKGHFFKTISDQDDDNSVVKPQKFCLQVEGLEESYINQQELQRFFSSFGPVYQISLVRRYKNKLSYFEQLDELQQQIKQQQLEIILGSGDKQNLATLRRQKQKLSKQISMLKIFPKTISAFVHFQYQKSKVDCLTYFNDHYLFNTCSHGYMRNCCCCCVNEPSQKYLFKGQKLMIKNDKVPAPDDINWHNFQIGICSKFFRLFFAFLIIIIFLAISCAIIALCSIYISTHSSDCDGITIPTDTTTAAASNSTVLRCYCNANLVASFTDSTIKSICQSYLTEIYIQEGIQYVVIISSSLTNFLFGLVTDKLINCIQPASVSSGMASKTTIYTIFLVLNSIIIPILIYADIFGFQAANYVSFLTLISTDISSVFNVSNLTFYASFSQVWYRNVSNIFTNFLVINTVIVWIFFIIDKYISSKSSLQDDEGKILQKNMNQQITSYKLDVYKEASNLYLIIIMTCLFFAGIPALLPLGMINIFSRYVTNRSLLQSNSSRIEGLGQDFMSITLVILPIIAIICPLVGEWMLTDNSDIYNDKLPMAFPLLNGLNETFLDRQLYLPFYIILSLVAAFEFLLFNTLIRFCTWLCSLCYQRKVVTHPYHTRPFAEYAKGMNVLSSYNIRNNDDLRNAVLNLEKYLVDKE